LLMADDTVNLNALYSHVQSVDTKFVRGLENYEKNTGIPHPLAVQGIESEPLNLKRARLTNFENGNWYTTIWIGTPPRPFTVQIDTGFSDLFVPGPSCLDCEGHTKWHPESSRTSNDKDRGFEIGFIDGDTISGDQYTDNVTISGLAADHQTIGAATTYSSNMGIDEFPPDGMLGMAFQSMSTYPDSPLFETLVNEEKVEEPVFSIKLTSGGGELYLGGSNTDLYTGEIAYTDVTVVGFWQVEIASIQGNRRIFLTDVPAIIDTGTNFIVGDPMRVFRLHRSLGGKREGDGFYSFPCNRFPMISFAFGNSDRTFQISASFLNRGPVWKGSPNCFSAIVSGAEGRKHWTLGGVFLMGVYTVFDFANKRVGFADLAT